MIEKTATIVFIQFRGWKTKEFYFLFYQHALFM